ncbi:hypothetical protein FXB41_27955 [Bradyrhizobium canariense]|uniref:S1/P1 nuclease n=1 Tax=Bradyrhizobium canariense TaxID=255045 RepID=UPI001CA54014|nr:S1/P1 nuclease [Bradyrhizobium canariense]MBW5438457.1 hypothetical protein [Bradyrhizobium canariense]
MQPRFAALICAMLLTFSHQAQAWNANGHQIVGAIADEMLTVNAKSQVATILAVNLRTAGPWLDCLKSVHRFADGTFRYVVEEAFEAPCKPFVSAHPIMQQYVKRNFFQCSYLTKRKDDDGNAYQEKMGCHNTYHFDDVAIQRGHFDRNSQGTNDHDIVAAITAAIAMLLERPSPPPFKIADKREALFLLAHLVGDLHQPLHVGAVYLDNDGKQVDPDVTHTIDPATETVGGNVIKDAGKNLHTEWDAPPTGFKVEQALDLLPLATACQSAFKFGSDAILVQHWSCGTD